MINTIIFDIGQVLANFRWREFLVERGYDEVTIDKIAKATVLSPLWKEEDRSAIEHEQIIWDCCGLDPSVAEEIVDFFDHQRELVREYPYSKKLIEDLKANGYKVYLLSNYGDRSFQNAKRDFEFIKLVDGYVISYEVKHVKPEPEIYEALLDNYNIVPEEAVFLDDLAENLEAAEKFGLHTILFTNLEDALEQMRKLGIRI